MRRPPIWPSMRSVVAPGTNHTPLTLTWPEERGRARATLASIALVSELLASRGRHADVLDEAGEREVAGRAP